MLLFAWWLPAWRDYCAVPCTRRHLFGRYTCCYLCCCGIRIFSSHSYWPALRLITSHDTDHLGHYRDHWYIHRPVIYTCVLLFDSRQYSTRYRALMTTRCPCCFDLRPRVHLTLYGYLFVSAATITVTCSWRLTHSMPPRAYTLFDLDLITYKWLWWLCFVFVKVMAIFSLLFYGGRWRDAVNAWWLFIVSCCDDLILLYVIDPYWQMTILVVYLYLTCDWYVLRDICSFIIPLPEHSILIHQYHLFYLRDSPSSMWRYLSDFILPFFDCCDVRILPYSWHCLIHCLLLTYCCVSPGDITNIVHFLLLL